MTHQPCPFCGSAQVTTGCEFGMTRMHYHGRCSGCRARGQSFPEDEGGEVAAIESWNTRAALASQAQPEQAAGTVYAVEVGLFSRSPTLYLTHPPGELDYPEYRRQSFTTTEMRGLPRLTFPEASEGLRTVTHLGVFIGGVCIKAIDLSPSILVSALVTPLINGSGPLV